MKRYYIDSREKDGLVFLAGPFPDEATARKYEIEVASFALAHGELSPFGEFGVTGIEGGYDRPGKLNAHFVFAPGDLMT